MRRDLRALPILCSFLLAGCGTCSDVMFGMIDPGGPYFYRGVRGDLEMVRDGHPVVAADIPLSAIADTVMIPVGCVAMCCTRLPLSQPLPKFDLPVSDKSTTAPVSVGMQPDEAPPR